MGKDLLRNCQALNRNQTVLMNRCEDQIAIKEKTMSLRKCPPCADVIRHVWRSKEASILACHGFGRGWFDWPNENSAGGAFSKRHCFFFDRYLVLAPVDQSCLVAI